MPGQNERKLKQAGVLREVTLPKPHRLVVEELTSSEVDVLIDVKKRLAAADEAMDPTEEIARPAEGAHFTRLMPY